MRRSHVRVNSSGSYGGSHKDDTIIDGSTVHRQERRYRPLRDVLNSPPGTHTSATRDENSVAKSADRAIDHHPSPQPFTVGLLPFSVVAYVGPDRDHARTRSSFLSLSLNIVRRRRALASHYPFHRLSTVYQPSLFNHAQAWRNQFGSGPDRSTLSATNAQSPLQKA